MNAIDLKRRRSANVRAKREEAAKGSDQDAVFARCSDVAETVGLSKRALQLAIDIATKLATATKAGVRSTRFENHQGELLALAKLDAEMQTAVCDLLFADPPKAGSVAEAELIAHSKASLAHYKVPKRVIFATELPRNASGKILKRELRVLYGGGESAVSAGVA